MSENELELDVALVGEHQPLTRCRSQVGGFVQQLSHFARAGGNSLGGQVAWLGMAQHHLRHICKERSANNACYSTRAVLLLQPAAMTLKLGAHLPRYLNI